MAWVQQIKQAILSEPTGERREDWEEALLAVYQRICYYFPYHRSEIARLLSEGIGKLSTDKQASAFELAILRDPDTKQLSVNMVLARAHVIAAAQSLHAACDIFARLAYWSLRMNTNASIDLNRLSVHAIHKNAIGQSKLAIGDLIASSEFRYLAAFVNANKHRQLISARPVVSFEGDRRAGLAIRAFIYPGKNGAESYPDKWLDDFLDVDCETIIAMLNRTGEALAAETV